ncbi:MAG: sigma-70 family RNA polymerase sigma factor [Phycisphaerales bacterium]|nr:sigma-70 family RNA polymerase sigma factor [Phycisphaerales bacterium]
MDPTSAALMLRLKADGDAREVAWTECCERYEPIIVGFARRQGLSPSQLPDLVQQIVMGFFAAQPRFTYNPEKGRFRGYLKTCVAHEIQRLRTTSAASAKRERSASVNDEAEDRAWDAEGESQQLRAAMERVRASYRDNSTFEAFHRVFVLNEPADRVAADLGLSRDSVYQAKTRVLAKLQVELALIGEQMGD